VKFSIFLYRKPKQGFSCRSADQAEKGRIAMRDRDWTPADVAALELLWQDHSAYQAGKVLGRTRNAVCGKLSRLRRAGVQLEPKTDYIIPPRKVGRAPPPKRKRIKTMQSKPLPPSLDRLAMDPCPLVELGTRRCRWPLGPTFAPAIEFCGGRTLRGMSYCPHHLRIAYKRDPNVSKGLTGGGGGE
jgi:GcrA cell cycle regulator